MLSSRQSLRPGVKIVPVLVGKLNRQMAAALAADISWLIASSGISVGLVGCANMGHRGPLYGTNTPWPADDVSAVTQPARGLPDTCFCCLLSTSGLVDSSSLSQPASPTVVCCRATCQPRRSLVSTPSAVGSCAPLRVRLLSNVDERNCD